VISIRTALVLATALLPAGLSAQQVDLSSRVDADTWAAVQSIFEEAGRDSLPLQALESKVLEGAAKNVPAARIGQVVAQLAQDFREARASLREALPDQALLAGEVVAVATATRQGVGVEVSRALWEARAEGSSLEVPVTVLGELVRRGVPVDEAAFMMTHVVRSSVPLTVTAQIPGKFDNAAGGGAPPGAALGEALRALNIPDPPAGRGGPPGRGRGRGG
jgi:hypothetical protein